MGSNPTPGTEKRSTTKRSLTDIRSSASIGLTLVVPFMILEWVNRRNLIGDFPVPLFGMMWLLPTTFFVIMMPITRNLRTGNSVRTNASLLVKVALLGLIAWMWVAIVIDQMPCFLGVPNCD